MPVETCITLGAPAWHEEPKEVRSLSAWVEGEGLKVIRVPWMCKAGSKSSSRSTHKRNVLKNDTDKPTTRCHFIPTRMALIKKWQTVRSVGEDVETLKLSYIVSGNTKQCSCLGKQVEETSKC